MTVTVTADTAAAQQAIDAINNATIDDKTLIIYGDNTAAYAAINNVNNAVINAKTLVIAGNHAGAMASINAIAAYDGDVLATSYINIVTRNLTGAGFTARHGGIPGFAAGGVLFEAGEAGPELAYFAGGGMALIPQHGLYMAPEGTYISPNNALNGVNVGGVSVAFNGNFYGSNRDELNQWAARDLIPTITTAIQRAERGQGVR